MFYCITIIRYEKNAFSRLTHMHPYALRMLKQQTSHPSNDDAYSDSFSGASGTCHRPTALYEQIWWIQYQIPLIAKIQRKRQ